MRPTMTSVPAALALAVGAGEPLAGRDEGVGELAVLGAQPATTASATSAAESETWNRGRGKARQVVMV